MNHKFLRQIVYPMLIRTWKASCIGWLKGLLIWKESRWHISGCYRDIWPEKEVATDGTDAIRCLSNEALSRYSLFKNSDVIIWRHHYRTMWIGFVVTVTRVMTWSPLLYCDRSPSITLLWMIIVLMIGCLVVWQRWIDPGEWDEWDKETMWEQKHGTVYT
jgi:hypothetical protein